jgi:hypothetical protein
MLILLMVKYVSDGQAEKNISFELLKLIPLLNF